jgi:hypothetical protein
MLTFYRRVLLHPSVSRLKRGDLRMRTLASTQTALHHLARFTTTRCTDQRRHVRWSQQCSPMARHRHSHSLRHCHRCTDTRNTRSEPFTFAVMLKGARGRISIGHCARLPRACRAFFSFFFNFTNKQTNKACLACCTITWLWPD